MKEQYLSDCMTWWAGVTKNRGGARGEPGAGKVTKPTGSEPLGEQQEKYFVYVWKDNGKWQGYFTDW